MLDYQRLELALDQASLARAGHANVTARLRTRHSKTAAFRRLHRVRLRYSQREQATRTVPRS